MVDDTQIEGSYIEGLLTQLATELAVDLTDMKPHNHSAIVVSDVQWDKLNICLQQLKDVAETSTLLQLLTMYECLSVSVDLLKRNNCAKTVKHLTKSHDDKVKSLANSLVGRWMQAVKHKSSADGSSHKVSKTSSNSSSGTHHSTKPGQSTSSSHSDAGHSRHHSDHSSSGSHDASATKPHNARRTIADDNSSDNSSSISSTSTDTRTARTPSANKTAKASTSGNPAPLCASDTSSWMPLLCSVFVCIC